MDSRVEGVEGAYEGLEFVEDAFWRPDVGLTRAVGVAYLVGFLRGL
jgi:hypothetical protein